MADEFNSAGEYNDMSYSGHDSSMERIVSIDFDQVPQWHIWGLKFFLA